MNDLAHGVKLEMFISFLLIKYNTICKPKGVDVGQFIQDMDIIFLKIEYSKLTYSW